MRASFCVNVLLNRFINAKYVLSSDVDSYEDGDGQALRDTLNRCEIQQISDLYSPSASIYSKKVTLYKNEEKE